MSEGLRVKLISSFPLNGAVGRPSVLARAGGNAATWSGSTTDLELSGHGGNASGMQSKRAAASTQTHGPAREDTARWLAGLPETGPGPKPANSRVGDSRAAVCTFVAVCGTHASCQQRSILLGARRHPMSAILYWYEQGMNPHRISAAALCSGMLEFEAVQRGPLTSLHLQAAVAQSSHAAAGPSGEAGCHLRQTREAPRAAPHTYRNKAFARVPVESYMQGMGQAL